MSDPKNTFTTSHAKSINMGPENSLDRVPSVKEQFDKAKTAQYSLEKARSKPNTFTTSVAKTVQMGKPNSLDRVPSVKGQFDKAKAAQAVKHQAVKAPASTPQMKLAPGGALQKEVDRPIQAKQLSDYHKQLKEQAEAIKVRNKQKNSIELNNGSKNNDEISK